MKTSIRLVRKSEFGSAVVETALALTVLAALLFGVMRAGMLLFAYHFISEAAREGSRYAIVRGSACTSWGTACPASASDVQTYVRGLNYPSINSNSLTVTTTWPDSNSNQPGKRVRVRVQYPFSWSVPFMPSRTINMESTSAMVISQ